MLIILSKYLINYILCKIDWVPKVFSGTLQMSHQIELKFGF